MEIKEEIIIEGIKKKKNIKDSKYYDNKIKNYYKEFEYLKT